MNLLNPSSNTPKILVIEDDAETRALISRLLERSDYQVETAPDGESGIELAQAAQPDLILCDIMMPGMDGPEVFRRLHESSKTATIPFVFLTALASSNDILAGMRLGVDDYITKPVTSAELIQTVQIRLNRRSQVQVEQLRAFTVRLVQSRERERHRLALDLQNDVQNTLHSLKYSLELLDDSKHTGVKSEAEKAVTDLVNQIDSLIAGLHPTIMDHLGLLPTLRWLVDRYELPITFIANNLDYNFDIAVQNGLFRILQLALNNVVDHAQATRATLEVQYDGNYLEAILTDKGIGFNLEEKLASLDSNGLVNMYELATALESELLISSTTEESDGDTPSGTVVTVKIPIDGNTTTALISDPKRMMRKVLNDSYARPQSTQPRKQISIALAIEQEYLRQGIHRLLRQNHNYVINEILNSLDDIEPYLQKQTPDLLIIDPISMKTNHFDTELIQKIMKANPNVRVLVLSSSLDSFYVANAISAGAHGYAPSGTTLTDLYTAINNTARGEIYISPVIQLDDAET